MTEWNLVVLTGITAVTSGVSAALLRWMWRSDAAEAIPLTAPRTVAFTTGESIPLENRSIENRVAFLAQQGGVPGPPHP